MNPGLYNDVIILESKRRKKNIFPASRIFFLTGTDIHICDMFICQPALLQKVEDF